MPPVAQNPVTLETVGLLVVNVPLMQKVNGTEINGRQLVPVVTGLAADGGHRRVARDRAHVGRKGGSPRRLSWLPVTHL